MHRKHVCEKLFPLMFVNKNEVTSLNRHSVFKDLINCALALCFSVSITTQSIDLHSPLD